MEKGHLRQVSSGRFAAAALALATGTLAVPASASVHAIALPAVIDAVSGCAFSPQPLSPASAPLATSARAASKSAAVLGGAPSALDAIRAQQASFASAPAADSPRIADAGLAKTLSPGIDASVPAPPCSGLVASRTAFRPGNLASIGSQTLNPENFLASKRVRIGNTNFDKDWNRVRSETLSAAQLKRSIGSLPAGRSDALEKVNRWANRAIRYTEDSAQYGRGDFWAGARKTLKAGRGDCEDIALVKMQLLAAAGVPHDDMILTIARDLVRNADHAVLIVRTDAGYRMLDNATDEVLDAAPSHDYRPILSFGNQSRWLHGV